MINSKANEIYKNLVKLKKNKDFLFLDSPKLIQEAINSGFQVEYIIKNETESNLFEEYKTIELKNSLFDSLKSTVNSQGIIAVIKNTKKEIKPPKGNFLVLDEVQDPGNVGTLIRSAVGFDFKDIYLINSVNVLNEKLVRSSMGGVFKANVYEMSREEFVSFYKENLSGFNLFCADMNGENIFEKQNIKNVGLVLGNEGNGVSQQIRQLCNKTISIPMKNNLESLNVAVAGSIIMSLLANL
ncbi:MAG: RNA methyltransferase [Clostridia bacterium]|nr:RNA methyltransferase [Clostridia bacterium]